jgi:predicted PurR-regulated permease PerM
VFAFDDRAGNVATTVVVFAAVVVAAFVARATIVVFVLALLLAYVLEPIVAGVERLLPAAGARTRGSAIAIVYTIGALFVVAVGYAVAPTVAEQWRRMTDILPTLAGQIMAMAPDRDSFVVGALARVVPTATVAAEDIGWLLIVPIITVFFLENRTAFLEKAVDVFARRSDCASARRTIQQIDRALAEYTRAQLVLAGLSTLFYWLSMTLLRFPYPLTLAIVGGALEFVPIAGWITTAAAILVSGWLGHAHWIVSAPLIVAWRLVQNFVNAPRLMGDRLHIEPISVLFTVMVGAQLGGLIGVVLSIPVVAVLRIVQHERSNIHRGQLQIATRAQPDSHRD